jgi:hypothetical protein
VLVIENAATWHSYSRWNADQKHFSAVVYGCGNRIVDGIASPNEIFAALGGPRRVLYFGDLDLQGLLIPQEASGRAQAARLPANNWPIRCVRSMAWFSTAGFHHGSNSTT